MPHVALPSHVKTPHETISWFMNGDAKFQFDDYHNAYHRDSDPEDVANRRALVAVAYTSLQASLKGTPSVYALCAISSGYDSHQAAIQHGWHTTDRIDEIIGGQQHGDIILQNSRHNLQLARHAQSLFPTRAIIPPAALENAVRSLKKMPALSRGDKWQSEEFMSLWFPVIDIHCDKQVLHSDWNYSRNAILEVFRGLVIQAGMVPHRPKCDMDVTYLDGSRASLFDRAVLISDYICDMVPQGIQAVEGATTLARLFHIHRCLTSAAYNEAHGSPIDKNRLHSSLKRRSRAEIAAMDTLINAVEPFLQGPCLDLGLINPEGLPEAYQRPHLPDLSWPVSKPLLSEIMADFSPDRLAAARELAKDARKLNYDAAVPEALRRPAVSQRVYEPEKTLFGPEWRAKVFEDDLAKFATEREHALMVFSLGALETPMHPVLQPAAVGVVGDMKRGLTALKQLSDNGITLITELPGILGRKFDTAVGAKNRALVHKTETAIARQFGSEADLPTPMVVGTPQLLQIDRVIEAERNAAAAPGQLRLGPRSRIALLSRMVERNAGNVAFLDGWEASEDMCQLMVRQTLIQLGLVERPFHNAGGIGILNQQGQEIALLERIQLVSAEVMRHRVAGEEVPVEISKAAARLLEIGDWLTDPQIVKPPVIKFQDIDPHRLLPVAQRDAFLQHRALLRPVLLEECVRHWPEEALKDLSVDYRHAWHATRGQENERRRVWRPQEELVIRHGPADGPAAHA
jgi:hypothetical protein